MITSAIGLVSKTDHVHRSQGSGLQHTFLGGGGGGRNSTCNTHPRVKQQTKGTRAELTATWPPPCGLPQSSLRRRRLKRSVCPAPGPLGKGQRDLPTSPCGNWEGWPTGFIQWPQQGWICSQSTQARLWLSPEASGVCQTQATRQQACYCVCPAGTRGLASASPASNSVSCVAWPRPCIPQGPPGPHQAARAVTAQSTPVPSQMDHRLTFSTGFSGCI